jgi:nucleotide-binding universal stress UspA family protein
MPFQEILIALDGSKNSQTAAEYGFWLASNLDAELAGLHVVDPRLVDYFIEPEFGEELGFTCAVETSEKVFIALRKIGKTILDLFSREAEKRETKIKTFLSEGHVLEEILKRSEDYDVLIVGHRGRYEHKLPTRILIGSLADRVAREAKMPVLIARQPVSEIKQVLVAFDGSEASVGALLMAENLAKLTNLPLRAVTVVSTPEHHAEAQLALEKGESYLREYWPHNVFSIIEGPAAHTILKEAKHSSLLVVGAYGYDNKDQNVLGSTTASLINHSESTILIFRPHASRRKSGQKKESGAQMIK